MWHSSSSVVVCWLWGPCRLAHTVVWTCLYIWEEAKILCVIERIQINYKFWLFCDSSSLYRENLNVLARSRSWSHREKSQDLWNFLQHFNSFFLLSIEQNESLAKIKMWFFLLSLSTRLIQACNNLSSRDTQLRYSKWKFVSLASRLINKYFHY